MTLVVTQDHLMQMNRLILNIFFEQIKVAIFYAMDARHPECKSNIVTKVEKLLSKNGKIENSFALSIDNELAQRISQIINCPIPNPKTDNYLKKGRFIPLVTIATRLTDGDIRLGSFKLKHL